MRVLKSVFLCGIVLIMGCGRKEQPWQPALEENTVYSLNTIVAETRNHLDSAREFQRSGRSWRATEELEAARNSIDRLESYYLPLINSRAHLSAALRLSNRGEFFKARTEMVKAREQLARAQAASAERKEDLQRISDMLQEIETELGKERRASWERCTHIATQLNSIITGQR